MTAEEASETTHACPPDGSGVTPCCGRTPFELPHTDRITVVDDGVTCEGPEQEEPDDFVIALREDDGTLIVGIRGDGTIQRGPNYEPDAAADEFWQALTRAAQNASPIGGQS